MMFNFTFRVGIRVKNDSTRTDPKASKNILCMKLQILNNQMANPGQC